MPQPGRQALLRNFDFPAKVLEETQVFITAGPEKRGTRRYLSLGLKDDKNVRVFRQLSEPGIILNLERDGVTISN